MDDDMLEKVNAGFPDLKLVKIEETSAESVVETPPDSDTSVEEVAQDVASE